jgi:uncharacterized membrane protein
MQRVEKSIRVKAPVEHVYRLWRDFENFPRFMEHVQEVRRLDGEGRISHWKLKAPLGMAVEFDAELTEDQPNRSIAWNSRGGSMGTTGNVTFGQVNGETALHVAMQWRDPPGGPVGEMLSRILQNPEQMLEEDLRRFKDIAEERSGSGSKQ